MAGQRKNLEWIFIIFINVLSAIAIFSIHAGEAEETPSVYIVKEGDTLWNISRRYLVDPFHWPALWEMNKHIKDPQWIYPGQPLMLKENSLLSDNLVRSGHPARVVTLPSPQPDALPAEALPPPLEYMINRDLIDSCGYILPKDEFLLKEKQEQWGSIIDGEDGKISYSCPDLIYINKGKKQVTPGSQFTVFRSQDMIHHPETDREIGYPVQILGIIEVVQVYDKIAKAKITKSFSEIHLQDRIKAYHQIPLPVRTESKSKIQGMLIASEDGRLNLATQNIVFLDQGKKQKIQAGNSFSIYRKDPVSDDDFKGKNSPWPEIINDVIGELLILKAEENTSTAVITKSEDAIMVGYLFSVKP